MVMQLVVVFGDRCWLGSHTAVALVASSAGAAWMASFWLLLAAFGPWGMANGEGGCCTALSTLHLPFLQKHARMPLGIFFGAHLSVSWLNSGLFLGKGCS